MSVLAILASLLLTQSAQPGQASQRAQGGTAGVKKLPVFGLLLHGVPASVIGAGTLVTQSGGSTTTDRSATRSCALADGGTTTLATNTPCVESLGLLVDGSSEFVKVGPVTLGAGTSYSISADYTPTTMDTAHNGDILMMWTTGNDMIWGRLLSGDFGEFNCGAYDGSAEYDVYTTAHFTDGVTGHFSCSYDGTAHTLRACLDGSCVSASKTFTRTTSALNNVYLMNDSFFTGLPVMPGHLQKLCMDPSPTKCH